MDVEKPKTYRYFESQEANEKVLIVTRKHWLYLLTPMIVGLGIILLALVFYYLVKIFVPSFVEQEYFMEAMLFFVVLFDATYVFSDWLIRYYNIILLTDEHLVEIEQVALFSRKVSVLDLDQIEDTSFSQNGFLQTMLDFGNLEIQTAGELRNFIFKNIYDPDTLQERIMELKELEENERKNFHFKKGL